MAYNAEKKKNLFDKSEKKVAPVSVKQHNYDIFSINGYNNLKNNPSWSVKSDFITESILKMIAVRIERGEQVDNVNFIKALINNHIKFSDENITIDDYLKFYNKIGIDIELGLVPWSSDTIDYSSFSYVCKRNYEDHWSNTFIVNYKKHSFSAEVYDFNQNNLKRDAKLKLELYPHQQTLIHALLELENRRVITISDNQNVKYRLLTKACILAEPFGSGKTFIILGLIDQAKTPKMFPVNCNVSKDHYISAKFSSVHQNNLIIVGRAVINQWEDAIKIYTNLTYIVISDIFGVKKFYEHYVNGTLNYDIVLVKNGSVNNTLEIEGNNINSAKINILELLNIITKNSAWARAIYDDFDTVNLLGSAKVLNAIWTIYVSASEKKSYFRTEVIKYTRIMDKLLSTNPVIQSILDDSVLRIFKVQNTPCYNQLSMRLTPINYFKYIFKNSNDKIIGMIDKIDTEVDITEALNADALGTAAKTLGIETNSVGDMFEMMLGAKYKEYIHYIEYDNALQKMMKYNKSLPLNIRIDEKTNREYTTDLSNHDVENFIKRLSTEYWGDWTDYIEFTSPKLEFAMIDEINRVKKEIEILKMSLDRVKDNIQGGECQICVLPLEGFDIFINKCCGLIMCAECGIKGNHIGKRGGKMMGICSNCNTGIDMSKNMMFISRDFDLQKVYQGIKNNNVNINISIEEKKEDSKQEENPQPVKTNSKLNALLQILNGYTDIPEKQQFKSHILHLVEGVAEHSVPQKLGNKKKIIIFNNYEESINNIINFLNENDVPFIYYGGNYRHMAELIHQFKTTDISIIIINSSITCAGINLQMATDVIFFHKIKDKNIEGQVAGRAQRIGRTCDLNIHYLLYENENMI